MTCLQRVVGCLLGASLVAGCSGMKTYPDTLAKNLHVKTEASSSSARMRVALDIHQVDASCRTEYQGTVQLDQPSMSIGIPPGRQSYLVFVFEGSSFLRGSSSINYGTLLSPRAGYSYDAQASYKDGIYHVEIREIDPRRSASREIERRGLSDCGRPW